MGLVEVLVAVLIFAVGLLGMAAMQLAAKKSSYEATQRSIATSLSRDILERMRSNPGQIAAYVANDVGDTSSPPATRERTVLRLPVLQLSLLFMIYTIGTSY